MPFAWSWRMPTGAICAWLAQAASKVKQKAKRLKVFKMVIGFFEGDGLR